MLLHQLLNRRPPFGHEVLATLRHFPQYTVDIQEVHVTASDTETPVEVELSITCGLVIDGGPSSTKKKNIKGPDMTIVLTLSSDLEFIDFRRAPYVQSISRKAHQLRRHVYRTKQLKATKTFSITAGLTKPSQSIIVIITSVS